VLNVAITIPHVIIISGPSDVKIDDQDPPRRGADDTAAVGIVGRYKTKVSNIPTLTAFLIHFLMANSCRYNRKIAVLEVK
jgi:hypothetical protein